MNDICLVTGVASGMGAATANLLASQGIPVVGWDLRQHDAPYPCLQVDVADAASVAKAWEATVARGRVGGLVNAAGIWRPKPFQETTLAFWRETFAINVEGTFNCCSVVVPHMSANGSGAIVNISSLAVMRPPKIASSAYAASKGAVLSFTRALAAEVGGSGIRVNCILPGAIHTPMLTGNVDAEQLDTYSKQSSLGRLGTPAEIAETIAFLLSERGSIVHGAAIELPAV